MNFFRAMRGLSRRLVLALFALALGAGLAAPRPAAAQGGALEAGIRAYNDYDYEEAMKILLPVADGGDIRAVFLVANMYFWGTGGVELDHARAFRYYTIAADANHRIAMMRLGYLYATGQGTTASLALADKWYRAAGARGVQYAYEMMGDMFFIQSEADDDEKKQRRYLILAAQLNSTAAQYTLGIQLMAVEEITRDHRRAYAWLEIAARRGHREAREFLQKNQALFNPAEAKRGALWAREYFNGRMPAELKGGY